MTEFGIVVLLKYLTVHWGLYRKLFVLELRNTYSNDEKLGDILKAPVIASREQTRRGNLLAPLTQTGDG